MNKLLLLLLLLFGGCAHAALPITTIQTVVPVPSPLQVVAIDIVSAQTATISPIPLTFPSEQWLAQSIFADRTVRPLVEEAMAYVPIQTTPGRYPPLIEALQFRLDILADTSRTNNDRFIDHYWISSYSDRTQLFVKPTNSDQVLLYTLYMRAND